MAALRGAELAATELSAKDALILAREALYRETAGSQWKPTLIGDRVMPRLAEDEIETPGKAGLLWPSLRSQIFRIDAVTHGGQRVEIGENEYASVDLMIGPEDPRPFVELASWLGQDRLPWRCSFILEGGGKTGMAFKEIGSSFLSIFPLIVTCSALSLHCASCGNSTTISQSSCEPRSRPGPPWGRRASSGDARQHSHNESRAGAM
jgi:intracellular multiplication protein IcmB